MDNFIMILIGVCGLISGVVIVVRPRWFKQLWKIRTSYELMGGRFSDRYYTILGLLIIIVSGWIIVKFGYLLLV
jgi:hypothetical protein